jgi:CubicO group peptidase (beta-lactamase class C family)
MLRTLRTPVRLGAALALAPCVFAFAGHRGIPTGIPEAVAQERPAAETRVEGTWVGRVEGATGRYRLDVEIARGPEGWAGTLIIPGSGRFEADSLEVAAESLRLLALEGQFALDARREGDALRGTFDVRGDEMEAYFVRSETPEAEELVEGFRREAEALREAATLELTEEGSARDRVDHDSLLGLLEAAERSFTTSLVVLHDGALVGEWQAGGERRPVEAMSVTKVALNLAVGRLLTLGELESLDVPVHAYFPEWAEGSRADVTVRHLLNHTSGLPPGVPTVEIYEAPDVVRYALGLPLQDEPGTVMRYNNNATNLLAGVVGRAAGKPVDEFLRDDLFATLGITDFHWMRDPAGNPHGMAGLRIHARDLARLGQLALEGGVWEGRRLIDATWFEESFRDGAPGVEGRDMLEGRSHQVGLIWFLLRDDLEEAGDARGEIVGVMHSGDLGQWLVVYPEERLVGVRMIEYSPAYDAETDAFFEFRDLLRELGTRLDTRR